MIEYSDGIAEKRKITPGKNIDYWLDTRTPLV